jgi:phage regulator Rha-like protein
MRYIDSTTIEKIFNIEHYEIMNIIMGMGNDTFKFNMDNFILKTSENENGIELPYYRMTLRGFVAVMMHFSDEMSASDLIYNRLIEILSTMEY